MPRDVGVWQVRAREQKRLARALAPRLAEAVAEVQGGGMPALAEDSERVSGHGQVFRQGTALP